MEMYIIKNDFPSGYSKEFCIWGINNIMSALDDGESLTAYAYLTKNLGEFSPQSPCHHHDIEGGEDHKDNVTRRCPSCFPSCNQEPQHGSVHKDQWDIDDETHLHHFNFHALTAALL